MPVFASKKSPAAYNYGAMALHWLLALLIIGQLCGGWLMIHDAALPDKTRFTFFQMHKTVGILILLLSVARLGWRLLYRPPADLPLSKTEKLLKNSVIFLFYALMLLAPLLGWAVVSLSSAPRPILLFGSPLLLWPNLPLSANAALYNQAAWAHAVLAYGFVPLLFLHIGGALKHRFYNHMPIMARIMPSRKLPPKRARASAFLLLLLLVFALGAALVGFGAVAA